MDFNEIRQYNFPTIVRFGAGVINELGDYLRNNDLTRPLIVTDPNVAELDFFKRIVSDLEKSGLFVPIYSEMHKNPVKSDVENGATYFRNENCDAIIGIGGGVAMDVARAIALAVNNRKDLFVYDDLIGGDKYITEPIPHFITVPTTSGTGSEVGRSAIISENESKRKRILFHPTLLAKIVFADPLLTMDLPSFITAATGMDALTHNMEAYMAKGYHPMCDGIALEGIKMISDSIETATLKPDLASRSKMLLASLMGAVAFQKGLGVVHSLAHPLSSVLDTHHGLANAVNLPYGMEFNYEGFEDRFDQMGLAMGLDPNSGAKVIDKLFELNDRLELPKQLGGLGVEEGHLEELSELAEADFCHPNNPKPVSKLDFLNIYKRAL
ncbi:MAG: iron-containing alcohol dehydrogenase [Flavobacteriales bacterium]|nr:iron-containing alcohol dehydrogenase [Flavobacteriales bacterium]